MAVDLSALPLRELLQKFAAGLHKPGSGSATALLGLISCAMAKTVIGLTEKRPKYEAVWTELGILQASIAEDIEPALWSALQDDAVQFDKVIVTRRERNKAHEPGKKWELATRALDELEIATEIQLTVAEKCLLLAEYAITLFDKGFQAARGDSNVAIDAALSGASVAISIVRLNLGEFSGNRRAAAQLKQANKLDGRAGRLKAELHTRAQTLETLAEAANIKFVLDVDLIRDSRLPESRYRKSDIEGIARNVQNELWRNRAEIWPTNEALSHVDALDPPAAFRALGYKFETTATLEHFAHGTGMTEIAGYIDKPNRYAAVSRQFPLLVQRFTAAHELGHAVLHKGDIQFRDRALDGSVVRARRTQDEYEADNFAVCFLMPESIMREVFVGIFGADQFAVSDKTAFGLGHKNARQLLGECPSIRQISLRIASATMYGRPVRSMAEIFGVSHGAMAIRIEELRLIDTNGHYT